MLGGSGVAILGIGDFVLPVPVFGGLGVSFPIFGASGVLQAVVGASGIIFHQIW